MEVLLKGDAVVTLTSLKELEDYGIKVDGDKLMLGEGWTPEGQYYTYGGGSLILETTLTGEQQNDGTFVFTNENPSLTELFSEDPYAIPDETLTFAALSSSGEGKHVATFSEERDSSQQDEVAAQGEDANSGFSDEGMSVMQGNLSEKSDTPLSLLEAHADELPQDDAIAGLERNESMDTLLGVSEDPDAVRQDGSEARSLDLMNMDTSTYPGLDTERGENAGMADSSMPVADGMDPSICHGIETTEDHANEEALREAITNMQAVTGGC